MSPLARRVRRTIRRRELLGDGDRVAVAVSGGPDSVALTLALRELAVRARWALVGLVHVNHGLRGAESDADEAFCRALATECRLPIVVCAADVIGRARTDHASIEAAARVERYRGLEQAARELGATRVATGHTMDDQAETVLLRLFRGAGGRGVSAIRARRGLYVRPLLDARRAEVEAYLTAQGATARDDSSNTELAIARNRLRHVVLPVITREWPGAVAALARFAELAADDERFLHETAREVLPAVAIPAPDGVQQIDVRGLNQLPPALSRRLVRQAMEAVGGRTSFRSVEAVRAFARARRATAHLDLDRVTVERRGPVIRFTAPVSAAPCGPFAYRLDVPGAVSVPETHVTVQASFAEGTARPVRSGEPRTVAVLQRDRVALPLTVRNRRPGDRFRPFGAAGTRKLQDLFVDRKVPRVERDRVPLVVDRQGGLGGGGGHAIANDCRVTTPESGMVILETKGNL